jgi:LysR family cys regulon transcriptional activator
MKLQQLKYLLAIADNGLNITAAADRLYTSQPGVSKQLKLLEEELGMQLFTRKGKSLGGITPAGEKVIERARAIMQEVENIRSLAANYLEEDDGSLSIGTTHTQARYVLPEIIAAFRQRFPNITLNLHQGTSEQIADMLEGNKIDFAIATGSQELFSDLLLVPSYRWHRQIIVPKGHPLTKLDRKVTLHDLVDYPLVTYVFSFSGESSLKRAFADRKDLQVIDAEGLFPRSTTWIGYRKDAVLRRYMIDFIQLFAEHISAQQLAELQRADKQETIDELFKDADLPLRDGCGEKITAAA